MIGTNMGQAPLHEIRGRNITEISREVGIKIPTIVSSRLWQEVIEPHDTVKELEIKRKLWDILELLQSQLHIHFRPDLSLPLEFSFICYIPNHHHTLQAVTIKSLISIDSSDKPVLTLLQPDEECS